MASPPRRPLSWLVLVAAYLPVLLAHGQDAPCPPLCPPAATAPPRPCSCSTACPVTPCPGETPDIDLLAEVCGETGPTMFTSANMGLAILHAERLNLRSRVIYRVRIEPTVSLEQAISRLKQKLHGARVEPNQRLRLQQGTIADDGFGDEWALPKIGAVDAWTALGWPGQPLPSGVAVAVVDTGVQLTQNDDLSGLIDSAQRNVTVDPPDQDVTDFKGHGTAMSGIIAAQINGVGYVGVMPGAKIIPCKMTAGDCAPMSAAIECLDWVAGLAGHRSDIAAVNFSFAGPGCSCILEDVVRELRCNHVPLVAAAGNDAVDNDAATCPSIPASLPISNVISVTAMSRTGSTPAAHGRHTVHVVAPGYAIWTWVPNWQNGSLIGVVAESEEGTSPATAHVSALLALLRAQDGGRTWSALRNLALSSGVTGTALTNLSVSGRRISAHDTSGVGATSCSGQHLRRRLRPVEETVIQAAPSPVSVTALDVTCASPASTPVPIEVWTVQTGGQKAHSAFDFQLQDDGSGADEVAGDGEFTAVWTPPSPHRRYELRPWGQTTEVLKVKVN